MTQLYLIRHGEAFVNVEPIIGGMQGDKGLTPRGVAQAEKLRDRLAMGEIKADLLLASPLPRARQTAEIIAPALHLPISWDAEVQEIGVGEADGMTADEAWAKYGQPNFVDSPFLPIAPGGEDWGQFTLRVGRALDRISRQHEGKTVVIVCHGGFIDGSFQYFLSLPTISPFCQRYEFYPLNTSITHWEKVSRRGHLRWQLISYNDAHHLLENK